MSAAFRARLLANLSHVRRVTALPHDQLGWLASIGFVGAQGLRLSSRRFGASHDNRGQRAVQQFYVMAIGTADDK